jgi:peroxidase
VGHDLVALNIQRVRDHGIDKYNAVRASLELSTASSFADITADADVQAALVEAYGVDGIDMVDTWIGGLAEDHVEGGMVGELFGTIIGNQFQRLMDADDLKDEGLKANVIDVETIKLADILTFNTGLNIPSSANVMTIEAGVAVVRRDEFRS